jgi:hypothetical protein
LGNPGDPLTNGTAETDDVPIRIGDGSLPLAVILVLGAIDLDLGPSPFFGHSVGILAVDVEGALTRHFASLGLSEVDREVESTMGKPIGTVMEGCLEARSLVPCS